MLARLAGLLCACAALGAALAPAAGARSRAAAASASSYPAGAERPALIPRPSEFASAQPARRPSRATAHAASHSSRKPAKKPKPLLVGNPARALVAFEAMQKAYLIPGSSLYEGEPFSYLWPFSQALAATVDMASIPHLPASLARTFSHEIQVRLGGLQSYLDTDNSGEPEGAFTSNLAAFDGTVVPPAGPGGTKYYDDNDWVGIELVRAYKLTHEAALLGSAEGIMAFEMAGWDAGPEVACPGGIPFSNAIENTDRNTVTTAPAAELAMQLFRVTGQAPYLEFAERAYEWVRACLLAPNGLYADHINAKGQVEETYWSYNQGSMIGAGTMLYQISGNRGYLYQARQTANAALAHFTPEVLASEVPFFPEIYFRNLLYLDSVTHEPPGPQIAQNYVNYAWQHLRLANNLFVSGSPPSTQLLVQAPIVEIYAMLSAPPSSYF